MFYCSPLYPLLASNPLRIISSNHPRWAWRNARSVPPPLGAACWMSPRACQFFFVSSTSCFHLQAFIPSIFSFNFRLQLFALFLAVLEVFFPPPYPPHRPAHSARQIGSELFFVIFCVFLSSIFLLFFRIVFFYHFWWFWARLGTPKSSQNPEKSVSEVIFEADFHASPIFAKFSLKNVIFGVVDYQFFILFLNLSARVFA